MPTESAGRVVVGLFRRIAEGKFHRLGQIVSGNELGAGSLSDFDRVADMIAMAVRETNQIDAFEGGQFFFALVEGRIGEPGID